MKNQTDTLGIGSVAPAFTLAAANRTGTFSLSDLLRRGPLIIEFMRGTWWPNCQKRLAQLEPHKSDIAKTGGDLVFLAAEKKDGLWKPSKHLVENPISYPFLLDEDRTVTKAYGLYHALGTDAFRIAHPATLVVDRAGMVKYIYRGEDQKDRAPFDQVLSALQKA